MSSQPKRQLLLGIALLLLIPIVVLQSIIDPKRHAFEPASVSNANKAMSQLPIEFALGALTGFKEAVAGLLWVRTDEYFHNGDYDAITPMLRIVTWLDPHQIDVYETGAWHMDYNFTDTDQRSDRRYIPLSIAFLNEGIQNNPNVPDIYADLAFTHYFRKIADFPKASETFAAGQKLMEDVKAKAKNTPDDKQAQEDAKAMAGNITTIGHGYAHSLEAQGRIPEAIAQWKYCVAAHEENMAKKVGGDYAEKSGLEVARKQLNAMQERAKWRQTDTLNPVNVKLHARIKRVAPKVFVVSGEMDTIGSRKFILETGQKTWVKSGEGDEADGCRVEVRLQDAGYVMPQISSFSLSTLNLDPNITIMQEACSVRKGKFERKIDMSKDPAMYSFTAPKYTLTFWFNPANPNDCPPNIQDRFGWLGQGVTDSRYLDLSGKIPGDTTGPIPGLRLVKKTITLSREDLVGSGEKVFE